MEIGELVSPPDMGVSDVHTEPTCPWHTTTQASATAMDATDPDDDDPEAMPPNDGGKLGRNMKKGGDEPPSRDSVEILYQKGAKFTYKSGAKNKSVQTYEEAGQKIEYLLQYAPHHLIPGNESLKGSAVVPFLGDDDVIANFEPGEASRIKKGYSVGYDVNEALNGVWLPSPYALSNKNAWPGEQGVDVLKKRAGFDPRIIEATEDFHVAYVAASIEVNGMRRQFHMRHEDYSEKVAEILKAIATRLTKMANGECPIASSGKDQDKCNPPMGLAARLNVLSANLKRFLLGDLWRPPLFADKANEVYLTDLEKLGQLVRSKSKGSSDRVV